jgi:glycerophosphoryl diester phosphodiesterase
LRINVELKHDAHAFAPLVRAVHRLLRGRARVARRVLLSSFEPRLLALAAVVLPEVPRALIVHAGQRLAWTRVATLGAEALGAFAFHPERKLCAPKLVEAWRRTGMCIGVWTVNDGGEAKDLAQLGVDALISDDPARVLAGL